MNFHEIELTEEQLATINGGFQTHFRRNNHWGDQGDDWDDRWHHDFHPHRQWHPGYYDWHRGHREWRPGDWE